MRFECAKCGKCCTGKSEVKFLKDDIEKLMEHIGVDYDVLCEMYDVENICDRLYIIHAEDKCPFVENSICTIQDIKPLFCRLYIPLIEPDYTPTYKSCDGIGKGRTYTQEDIDEINRKLCDSFNFIVSEVR